MKQFELISTRETMFARSANGTFIEIFEWASDEAKSAAHQHPAMMKLWDKMMPLCSFPALKDLPEAEKSFPNFELIG